VDVGLEGLLRRLGVAKPLKLILKPFKVGLPSKLILWDEVETIDFGHAGIKLSTVYSKLETLHASDLADIIEDMDSKRQAEIFASLNEERAADVLEELETDAQINVLEQLSIERAADVLEKMPADEVADILEEISDERAERLLSEMESVSSEEVRELMEYDEDEVGSLMSTDFLSFGKNMTVSETFQELRRLKPESDEIYYLYLVDHFGKLIANVSLRDLVISQPETRLQDIMNEKVVFVHDTDELDSVAEIISKYSLLAVPVVNKNMVMIGMVIIDDVVYTLLKSHRKRGL
ncbi:MAG TPA: CBS domain-containing protein, partial [Clostridia bacterium]|nr:CBS domain-containing protein [Clostridia bacterium]